MIQKKYLIFTKGSAQTQHNKSAYGYKILDEKNGRERHGTESFYGGTANRAELLAIVKALERLISYNPDPNHIFKNSFTIVSSSNAIIKQLVKRNQTAKIYLTNKSMAPYILSNSDKGPLLTKIACLMLHFKDIHVKYLDKYDPNNVNLKQMTNKTLNTEIPTTQQFYLPKLDSASSHKLLLILSKQDDE